MRGGGLRSQLRLSSRLCCLFSVVIVDDARNVGVGLTIGRHAAILLHAMRSRVVRGKRFGCIAVILQQ